MKDISKEEGLSMKKTKAVLYQKLARVHLSYLGEGGGL